MSLNLRRLLTVAAGVLLVFLGLGCLNYTKARGIEHHRAFARQHGLPEPSETILFSGAATLLIGASMIGYSLGSRSTLQ